MSIEMSCEAYCDDCGDIIGDGDRIYCKKCFGDFNQLTKEARVLELENIELKHKIEELEKETTYLKSVIVDNAYECSEHD